MDINLNRISKLYNVNSTSNIKRPIKSKETSERSSVVEVSDSFKEYQVARLAASGTSDIREDKVAEIKNAYESGKYQVNIEELANKMMNV